MSPSAYLVEGRDVPAAADLAISGGACFTSSGSLAADGGRYEGLRRGRHLTD